MLKCLDVEPKRRGNGVNVFTIELLQAVESRKIRERRVHRGALPHSWLACRYMTSTTRSGREKWRKWDTHIVVLPALSRPLIIPTTITYQSSTNNKMRVKSVQCVRQFGSNASGPPLRRRCAQYARCQRVSWTWRRNLMQESSETHRMSRRTSFSFSFTFFRIVSSPMLFALEPTGTDHTPLRASASKVNFRE